MKIAERPWYAVAYMFVMTLVASTVLIIFGNATRQRVEDNQRVAFDRAVLQAVPIGLPDSPSPALVHGLFADSIYDGGTGAGVYEFRRDGAVVAYALQIEGPGFWAPIRGVVGVAADMTTLTGLAIYEQNETPGLGGEIVKPYFQDQFRGKRMRAGPAPISIVPATEPLDEHSVHAITGATQTSVRLEALLNERLRAWRESMRGPR